MDTWMIVGLVVTIALIAGLSIYSGTKNKAVSYTHLRAHET